MKVMKKQEDAIAKGLVVWADDAAIEAMCLTCHDVANKGEGHAKPKKEFNFAEMYKTIAHPKPEK